GGQHVDALRGDLAPGQLAAEQSAVRRVHQPNLQRRAARVVLRPGPGDHVGGYRGQACGPRLAEPEPGARHLQVEHLYHRRTDDARERRRPARGDRPRHPAGLIGGGVPGGPRPARPPPGAAGPRGTQAGPPSTRCGSATQSPAANTSGSEVRMLASTTTDRSARCRAPAPISGSVAGRTPVATTTRSVPTSSPSTTAVRPPLTRPASSRTA